MCRMVMHSRQARLLRALQRVEPHQLCLTRGFETNFRIPPFQHLSRWCSLVHFQIMKLLLFEKLLVHHRRVE